MYKTFRNQYLESCILPPTPITKEEYDELSDKEKSMINIITPFFMYDQNYNYRIVL